MVIIGVKVRASAFPADVRSVKVTRTNVEIERFGQAESDTGERLVTDDSVFIVEIANTRHGRAVQHDAADTQADIRLDTAAAVEVIVQVRHRVPGMHVARNHSARIVQIVITVAQFALEAEAVGEGVANAKTLIPIVVEIRRADCGVVKIDFAVE